jgi:hypothetical protein
MPQFKSFAPGVRVSGRMVLAFIECVSYRSISPYLSWHGLLGRHGLESVDPEKWYYLQDWLDVLSDIYKHEDESAAIRDFMSIGRGMVVTLKLHEEVAYHSPLFEAIHAITLLFMGLHQGGDAGRITAKIISHGNIQVVACIPYPDDLLFGMLTEVAERYDASRYPVRLNTDAPPRDEGGEVTIYDIGRRLPKGEKNSSFPNMVATGDARY